MACFDQVQVGLRKLPLLQGSRAERTSSEAIAGQPTGGGCHYAAQVQSAPICEGEPVRSIPTYSHNRSGSFSALEPAVKGRSGTLAVALRIEILLKELRTQYGEFWVLQDAVLVMGLSAYLDFTDIAAKVGYTRDWEATEVPLGPFFRKDMSEDEVQAAQEAWLECLFSLPIRQLRGSGAAGHLSLPPTPLLAEM